MRSFVIRVLALAFSLTGASHLAWAEEPVVPVPQALLALMSQAATGLNYEGRMVVVSGNRANTLRLVHVRDGEREWERLVQLDGEQREIVRGQGDTLLLKDNAVVTLMEHLSPRAVSGLEQRYEKILASYQPVVGRTERVAGRPVWPLRLESRDDNRFNLSLWVDQETGLLLRSVVSEPRGRDLESLTFTEVRTGPTVGMDEYRAEQQAGSRVRRPVAKGESALSQVPLVWQITPPAGFVPVRGHMTRKSLNGAVVDSLTFSDGLASFTFFAEELRSGDKPVDQVRRVGAQVTAVRLRKVGGKRILVTVMGALAASAAVRIADTAQYTGGIN